MLNVFIVWNSEYTADGIFGVFSTREKARAAIDAELTRYKRAGRFLAAAELSSSGICEMPVDVCAGL